MNNLIQILEFENYSTKAISTYSRAGDVVFGEQPNYITKDVFCLVVRLSIKIDRVFLSRYPNLKWIASPTTGITHIDIPYASERNIKTITLRNCYDEIASITSTPELTLGLILSLIRNINFAYESVKRGEWERERFLGRQLSELNIGIIGFGRVGKQLSTYTNSIFKKTFFYDLHDIVLNKRGFEAIELNSVEKLCSKSDVIVLCASYNFGDPVIISRELFEKGYFTGKYLINTARGELVDELAIKEALENNFLLGYATDVISNEFNINDSPIISCLGKLNVIITPHIGGCTVDAMRETEEILANKFMELK